ncbi:MAG: amino acid ABC transporter ATP-binding protein [Bacteroidales bacterium]|nr:amino acid ABC transporter ATP-binding protein [Bacteroidales bacterium]
MIRINQITKSFEALRALDNVTLTVGRNELVSIIGYSGSGKSTLIRCIAGLESFESGSIVTGITPKNGYSGIGMVFSKSNLFPHLTILQNLVLAPMQVLGMSREEAEDEAIQMLDMVGIWSVKDSYPETLSSGQRQRAAIARSLMMKPEILLLDEPTSSLDPVATAEVFNVLSSLKNQDMTIVLVTHKIDLARSISDRIVFMANGRIYEQGTPSEIIDNPKEPQTKAFINHCINMVYEIPSSKYDHPELNARIEVFCLRYRLPVSCTHTLQLVVEELLNLIPLDDGVSLLITKSTSGLELEAVLEQGEHPYLSPEYVKDDLSYSILEGLCDKIVEDVNEKDEAVIRLTIRQNNI